MSPPHVSLAFSPPGVAPRHQTLGDFQAILSCHDPTQVQATLAKLDELLADGAEAVGFMAYDASPSVDPAMKVQSPAAPTPLLWFGINGQPIDPPTTGDYAFGNWEPAWSEAEYTATFWRIKTHLADGDSYQVNLTFPLDTTFEGDPGGLFHALCQAQNASYCAWIHTAEWDVVSASPELFFVRRGDHLLTRPMKGTRQRGMTTAADRAIAEELAQAPKDRAENVMIVDLLRNDLGRIARTGTVEPLSLFAVEKYPTVWQMTSTVQARLPADTQLSTLVNGLFPCGSVTGAPKIKTMELIAGLEPAPRGVYCGAIGYATRDEATFNVAIRTLTLANGRARYSVGSGLVNDSEAASEYTECLDKARVIARAAWPDFSLLETLLFEPDRGLVLCDRHLARLADSADYFQFPIDLEALRQLLDASSAPWRERRRVRLLMSQEGVFHLESTVLPAATPEPRKRLRLARRPVSSTNSFLYHKTTHRSFYEQARAELADCDDVVLYNERGELTETTIANLAVQLGDDPTWLTPPVACGLLAGTQRAELLATGKISEGIIHRDQLPQVTAWQLFNSVRGVMDADLIE